MNRYIDIHCHILPGIDDGAHSLEESVAMAKKAVADGVRAVIVTPHQKPDRRCPDRESIRKRTEPVSYTHLDVYKRQVHHERADGDRCQTASRRDGSGGSGNAAAAGRKRDDRGSGRCL